MQARLFAAARLAAMLFAFLALSSPSRATNVQFVGNVGYSYSGSTAVLTADRIQNFSTSGYSGTLRMEVRAFPTPFNGAQLGYKLAQYVVGQLQAGYYYYSIPSSCGSTVCANIYSRLAPKPER